MVALRAVEIPTDAAGVAGDGCKPGQSGEPVRGFEASDVGAGDGEEFRTEQRPETGSSILTGQPEVWTRAARLNEGGP